MSDRLSEFAKAPLDVLVIGGGIVGAGVARDAAMRGLRVGLVDRHDFAFGTSSRSSRLLHGGLRYLAQGRIGLVREASVEKVVLHRIAPHLAVPLPFIFPTRRGTEWKRWKLRIGVKLYDLLCGGRNLGKSSALSSDQTVDAVPGISRDNLTGAVRYFDGFTNDARLVLDTLRSAAAHGAQLHNYASFQTASRHDDGWRCSLKDEIDGQSLEVRARSVVNAAGAWLNQMPASKTSLRLTKGVHIVIDRARLPIGDAVVMAQANRILFAIPWGQRVILGTTDTDYSGDRAAPKCELEDVRYILDITNDTFPHAELTTRDVISAWAGLRPLIDNKCGGPSDISRRHLIQMTEPGWFDVAGGKLTTYRLMAEQTIDQVGKFLDIETQPCRTATTPLLPNNTDDYSAILPPAVAFEAVEHYCKNEWAMHLEDVMIRRTSWHQYHRDHYEIAHHVADWMGVINGWSLDRRRSELNAYRARTNLPFARDEASPELQVTLGEQIIISSAEKTHAG